MEMKKDVAILTPTRGKPEQLKRFMDSVYATTNRANVILFHDDGDKPVGPTRAVNYLWQIHPNYKYYMFGSDDHIMLDNGWCDKLIDAINRWPDKIAVAWTNDQCQGARDASLLTRFPMVSKEFLEALGYFFLPTTFWWYPDDVLTKLAYALGRAAYLPDVLSEHRHQSAHVQGYNPSSDYMAYVEWCANGFEKDLAKLREAINKCGSV